MMWTCGMIRYEVVGHRGLDTQTLPLNLRLVMQGLKFLNT